MMTTTEKHVDGDDDGASSSGSSPTPPQPFEPMFQVRFTSDITKDGDVVMYTIQVIQCDNNNRKPIIIRRQYEDFEYLEHCLVTGNQTDGIIVPPLPQSPSIDPHRTEIKSRKRLGSNSREMVADDFVKDCKQLEKYVELLLRHPVFGKDTHLIAFLTKSDPPPRSKVKKGLLARLSESMQARNVAHPDCDEFFQKERVWVLNYYDSINDASVKFNEMVCAQERLCVQVTHLATALNLSIGSNDGLNAVYSRVNARFSECLEEYKNGVAEEACINESTLGFYLDVYARYLEAESSMLLRRTCLMVDYENANRSLAKANNREAAEKTKREAEQAFDECSDAARGEIKAFHRRRLAELSGALVKLGEQQLNAARLSYSHLSDAIDKFKEQLHIQKL